MCRFVAVISKQNTDLNPYLDFLKIQAKEGKRAPHGDGFGFWILSDDGEHYYRTTAPAWKYHGSIPKGRIAFFHARKKGRNGAPISILNVHPFLYDGKVFMHNGSLKIDKHPRALGGTDTESFFLNLADVGLEKGLEKIRKMENFTSLNLVMWDGENTIIFRAARKRENYFTIYMKKENDKIIVSTEGDDSWIKLKNGEMIIIHKDLSSEAHCIFPDMCH